jgi:hypothetical protein
VVVLSLCENIFLIYEGKAIPLQALTGPEVSRRYRLPHFKTIATWRWQGCQPYALAAFNPGNILGTHFRQRQSRPQGHSAAGRFMSMKNSNDTIGNQSRDLPFCSAVPQPLYHCVLIFLIYRKHNSQKILVTYFLLKFSHFSHYLQGNKVKKHILNLFVRFRIFTAVPMNNSTLFWDMTPCRLAEYFRKNLPRSSGLTFLLPWINRRYIRPKS